MAVSKYEQVKEVTAPIESTFYELLDHLDEYRDLLARLIAQEESEAEPNAALIKRFRQFTSRADTMVKHLEDDVLTQMLWLLDRLFAVKDTEEGTFI